jgi:hypothetical protein
VPIPPLYVEIDPMVGAIEQTVLVEPLDVDTVVPPPVQTNTEVSA